MRPTIRRCCFPVLSTLLALTLLGTTSACGMTHGSVQRPARGAASDPSSGARAVPARGELARHRVTKLLVFVIENHSYGQMRAQMPFTSGLARNFSYATDFHAIRHPSLPNYLAIAGGSTFGVDDDNPPSAHRIHGSSVFGQALHHGRTAGIYADGMPSRCALDNGGDDYAVKHNPWAYFVDERAACRRHDVPLSRLAADVHAGRLPNAGMVIPNLVHDAHNASLAEADAWIRRQVNLIRSGPDWRSGRLAIVITADEDDRNHDNRILTVVAGRSIPKRVVRTPLGHYGLTRLYDDVLGVPRLRHAATAHSMARAFGIRVRAHAHR